MIVSAASSKLSSLVNCEFNSRPSQGTSSRKFSSTMTFFPHTFSGCHFPKFVASSDIGDISLLGAQKLRANNGILLFRCFSDKSSSTTNINSATPVRDESESGTSQHTTWVQFQRSIAVSGFETGQTVKERTQGKKNRGGKIDRKRKEREAEAEALLRGEDVTQVRGTDLHFHQPIFQMKGNKNILPSSFSERECI